MNTIRDKKDAEALLNMRDDDAGSLRTWLAISLKAKEIVLTDCEFKHLINCFELLIQKLYLGKYAGAFLQSVINNDLVIAFCRADQTNQKAMPIYASFIGNYVTVDALKMARTKDDAKENAKKDLEKLMKDADEFEFNMRREEFFENYPALMEYFKINKKEVDEIK